MSEAARHPHNVARGTFVDVGGTVQPAPAPRFSRTVPTIAGAPARAGEHTREVLLDWGVAPARVDELFATGAVR
jgi:alpha-methylacyl-CoA racemase